jgi:hypothetical protein
MLHPSVWHLPIYFVASPVVFLQNSFLVSFWDAMVFHCYNVALFKRMYVERATSFEILYAERETTFNNTTCAKKQ